MANEQRVSLKDIVSDLHKDYGHLAPKKDIDTLAEALFDAIVSRLARDQVVVVRQFGTFRTRNHKGRTMTPPGKEPITYPDSIVLGFKQSAAAKKRITKERESLGRPKKTKAKKKTKKTAKKK